MNTPGRLFIIILTLFIGINLSHAIMLGKTVYGDGRYYYAWLHEITFSRNLDFTDEYAVLEADEALPAKNGKPGNKYAVGPALVWLSPYLTLHRLVRGNGYGFAYQATVSLTSTLAVFAGLVILWRLLSRRYSPFAATGAIAALAGTTNLLFYGAVDTVNSHGLAFAAATLFLSLMDKNPVPPRATGAALATLGLIRPQDLIYALLLLPVLPGGNRVRIVKLVSGFMAFFWIALYTAYRLYGTLLPAYFSGGEKLSPDLTYLPAVLFSPAGSLFYPTPSLLIAAGGLILLYRKSKIRPYLKLFPILLFVHAAVISGWSTPSQGATYASRMTVSLLPVFGYGFAEIFQALYRTRFRFRHLFFVIIGPLSILNLITILWFLLRN